MGEYSGGAGSIPARRKPVAQVMDHGHVAGLCGTAIQGERQRKAQPTRRSRHG
jgi:hypothetical protein